MSSPHLERPQQSARVPDPQFWRGKRVLVTGHTGFKGSWLSLWLQALGADVLGFALPPPTEPSMFADARVATGMSSREGDTRSAEDVRQALRDHEPEIVLHLASQSLVRQSFDDPVDTYTTNVLGALNVLMAIKTESAARAVVIVTSDKCSRTGNGTGGTGSTSDLAAMTRIRAARHASRS